MKIILSGETGSHKTSELGAYGRNYFENLTSFSKDSPAIRDITADALMSGFGMDAIVSPSSIPARSSDYYDNVFGYADELVKAYDKDRSGGISRKEYIEGNLKFGNNIITAFFRD